MTTETQDAGAHTTDAAPQSDSTLATSGNADAQTGAEATPAAQTAQADGGTDKPAAPAAAEYEPFQLPEGMTVDEELLGEFKGIAKELGLSQEAAQKIASLQAKAIEKQQSTMRDMQTQWAEQSKTDKEFGGEAFPENLAVAKKAIDAFSTPELRNLLNASGLGNHPEVIRTFYRVGKQISEDGRVVSGSRAAAPSDPAKRLFPNQS